MALASGTNPNVCPGCVQLLDDDSPQTMALHTSVTNERVALMRGEEAEHRVHTFRHTDSVLH